ncbi:hypothetical protein MLD38_025029 [Melastoma candidum]|uniref:Uncharacterized protein n=1 Tax=Melastoma candidum TaxID=119954 RepID=A0ACB9NVT3_9MYRT|nr:hypothetical protein MLD38_025029 [Melastoma candidum]
MAGLSDRELGMELGFPALEDFLRDDDFIVDSDECSWNYEFHLVSDDDFDDVALEGAFDDDDFESSVPSFWDSLHLAADGPDLVDFGDDVAVEWEEIEGGPDDEGGVPSMVFNVENEGDVPGFVLDIAGCEGDIDEGVDFVDLEALGNLEWEVLYELGFDSALDDETAGLPVFVDEADDFYSAEHEPLFVRPDSGLGLLPASKSTLDELASKSVVCAEDEDRICSICKDGLAVGEEATKMPCDHVYHSDCIFTWLQIRNMCPVCRHELPTEDDNRHRERTVAADTE